MKRIILIAYDLNPTVGSECQNAYLWLKILSKVCHVHAFVADGHSNDLAACQLENVEFTFVKISPALRALGKRTGAYFIPAAQFLVNAKKILKQLDLGQYVLIHCLTPEGVHSYNDFYTLGLPLVIGPVGGSLSSPAGFEDFFNEQKIRSFAREALYKLIMKMPGWKAYFDNAVKIFIGTEYLKNVIPKNSLSKCRTLFDVMVDTEKFSPPTEAKTDSRIKILFAGKLESNKGILILIEAVSRCVKAGAANVELVVAGEGPLERKAKQKVADANMNSYVTFLGRISSDELIKQYQSCHIFCLPTLREPGGASILEAMSCALPVVTSDYGGPRYSVTAECGIKIEMTNPDQYVADLTKALCTLVHDAGMRKRLGENARARAQAEFSVTAMESKILNEYMNLLA